jgi:Zn-dependent peptidase ImmA (M78 family)/transcriptional regulator with XRE-family HTH domain
MSDTRIRNVPETPFGQRLRAARKMAGLSMDDLAAKLGGMVTKQAIAKYETGRMMPSPEVLDKLVEVLKIATWGASPLRLSDADLKVASREVSAPLPLETDVLRSPRFRRAGLLSRLRHMGQKEDDSSSVETMNMECPPAKPAPALTGSSEARHPLAPTTRAACLVSLERESPVGEEGFPALTARRSRFLRQWQEDESLNMIRFRAGERLSAKTAEALKYRIADYLQKCLELESILGQEAPFENPIAGRPARSRDEVEVAAHSVRDRWELGTGPIVNLLGLLEDKGIKVYEARGLEGFEGLSGQFGPVPFIAAGMEYPADRIRFTAAHELGHILCEFASQDDPESECHAFGAAFLLPRAALEKIFQPSRRKVTLGDLGEIKETYGVSLQAIMYRAHELALISDRQLRTFRETLKEKGWLVDEPVAFAGRERATRFRRLLRYAVAADIVNKARAAEMVGVTVEELEAEIGEIF